MLKKTRFLEKVPRASARCDWMSSFAARNNFLWIFSGSKAERANVDRQV